MTFSPHEKQLAAEREVRQRIKVYRRLVYSGRMTQADADREIEIMKEIAQDYKAFANWRTMSNDEMLPSVGLGGHINEREVAEDLLAIDKRGV